jgi:ubiquinol-cytochrome c reductase subunit 7
MPVIELAGNFLTNQPSLFCFVAGLRYEDLLIDQEPHVAEALALADPAVIQGRNRRVLRAFDLDLKKKNFTDYAPDVDQETFKTEIYDDITKIRERDAEYALINMHKK